MNILVANTSNIKFTPISSITWDLQQTVKHKICLRLFEFVKKIGLPHLSNHSAFPFPLNFDVKKTIPSVELL